VSTQEGTEGREGRERPTSSERIRREARVVGLRDFRSPSLEAVERRRMQLWIVTTVLMIAVSVGVAFITLFPNAPLPFFVTPNALRYGVVALTVGFCAYAIEKEFHLRKLSRMLIDERVLSVALSNRLHEVSLLLETGKAMNSVLELDAVLDVILRSALDLLEGQSGSLMMVDGNELVATCVRGREQARDARIALGQGIAGRVALTRDPLLINGVADPDDFPGIFPRSGDVISALSVPLVNREELLGVLNVNAEGERGFTEFDLRALSLFAEQAAVAIANARLYEAERSHVAKLTELDRLKSDFVAQVSHELRTPLTSILAAAKTVRRPELVHAHPEVVGIIERQARRLSTMVEELLTASKLEHEETLPPVERMDLAALVRTAVDDFDIVGRPVEVDAPDSTVVLGDTDSLRRVIDNLIDNAYKYGRPPVRITLTPEPNAVRLVVSDHGEGVPGRDRERVFEQFYRAKRDDGQPGLGLGLPIVRGLVLACGGDVHIEDAPGGGAAFVVNLPLAEQAKEAS